jgi:ATPase subunit of ABC transporter with duplicated ATPase domains
MSALLILDSISLTTPDGRPLFDGLTLAIGRERTGLVGRNGSGKSTLLRLPRRGRRSCCCWMSRPTISIWPQSSNWNRR